MTIRLRRTLAAASAAALASGFSLCGSLAKAAPDGQQPAGAAAPQETSISITAEQIVAKCLQAHGGLEAWGRLEAIFWKGYFESERLPLRKARFELTEKRPNKTRFELLDPAHKSVRVFDGSRGWKMRFGQDGRPGLQPYSEWEVKYAGEAPALLGPLLDFSSKGNTIRLVGREKIDARDCYRLAVRLASGEEQTVWVDAQTFLETRYDRIAYGDSGPRGIASTYYRDYRVVEGMPVPSLIEVGSQGAEKRDRMVIESVALNPKIPDATFARPPGVPQSHEVVIRPEPLQRPDAASPASPATSN